MTEERACTIGPATPSSNCTTMYLALMRCHFPPCLEDPIDALEADTALLHNARSEDGDDGWTVGDEMLFECKEPGKTFRHDDTRESLEE